MGKAASGAVLLHGFSGSAADWGDPVVGCLAAAGIVARALDLPGHGRHAGASEPSLFALDPVCDAIGVAASGKRDAPGAGHGTQGAARKTSPSTLIGYSMGGRIALHYAVRHPEGVTRLVLESASPGIEGDFERSARREADAALADRIEALGVERFVDEWEQLPLFASRQTLPERDRALVRTRRLTNDAASLAAALRGLGTGSLPSLWDNLSDLYVPTLIVVGELDAKFVDVGERMAAALPLGQLAIVPGAGHAVHREDPAAWCAEVSTFLKES
jgi:2-succinyl-6-hydroxy-2,4-cyclohexadiene-1-carboxylate synthase